MDFEAELAAFAEIEQLAEQTPVDANILTAPTSAANGTTAPFAAKSSPQPTPPPAAASSTTSAAQSKGTKRKSTADGNTAPPKKQHTIVAAAAAPAVRDSNETSESTLSAYEHIVAADRAAMLARQQAQSFSGQSDSSAAPAQVYVPGQVYDGWLAGLTADGQPCWLPATPENISDYALKAQQAADAEAIAQAALKKQSKAAKEAAAAANEFGAAAAVTGGKKEHLRTAAGKIWSDPTLEEWPENDYRIFCGDLGNDVTDQLLTQVFERWPSFVKARVVRDKRTGKTKGFGFASFLNFDECVEALKTVDGKYVGNRPVKLRRSDWTKREASKDKSWTAKHNQFGNAGTKGDRKLHLY